ncbi:MFS transporter [Salinibacterium sp. ZJ70]|uniref:MFS transporter n=1 Tax=Salinibacterium sp. ZJ70 TaxID=2708084 RepID=UPI00142277D8|nr:MFS transporter [Salinibacterium sp. ZJ70]
MNDAAARLLQPILGGLLCQVVVGIARPAVSYRALELGADEFLIGVLVAAFAVLPLVAAIAIGRLAGHARFVAIVPISGGVLLAGAAALAALAGDLVALGVASALLGLGNLVVLLGAQSWISRAATTTRYDAGFGWLTAGMSVGQAIGPLITGIVVGQRDTDPDVVAQAFWVAAGFALVLSATFISRATPRTGTGAEPQVLSPAAILRRPGVLTSMAVSVSLLTSVDILAAYLPVIGESTGMRPEVVGALLAIRGIASAVPRLLLGLLTRRWSRTLLVAASTIGGAATMIAVALSGNTIALAIVMLAGGFLIGLGQPLTMSLVALAVPREMRSEALAVRLVGNRIAQTAIPLIAGGLAVGAGTAAVFWVQGVFLASSTAWFLAEDRHRHRKDQ